jgi:hypothetical protein
VEKKKKKKKKKGARKTHRGLEEEGWQKVGLTVSAWGFGTDTGVGKKGST